MRSASIAKKLIYLPILAILLIIFVITNCPVQPVPNDDDDNDSNVIGGWVYCDPSYNPIANDGFDDYTMMDVQANAACFGYLSSLINGDFYTYYTSPSNWAHWAYTSWDAWEYTSGIDWSYNYTADDVSVAYSIGDDYFKIEYTTPGKRYYKKTRFEFDSNITAKVYYGYYLYGSTAGYAETSGTAYFKKITGYTNKGQGINR